MSRPNLGIQRLSPTDIRNRLIADARKPRIPSKAEMRVRKLQLAERRMKKEEEELKSVRFLVETIAKEGISSPRELAIHAGCKMEVVEKLFKKYPELQDQVRMWAERPRRFAKRALAKQMEHASRLSDKVLDKDVAKMALDYLKVRGDEDFRGDTGGGGYGGVQINIVGVSPTAVRAKAEPVRIEHEEDNDE